MINNHDMGSFKNISILYIDDESCMRENVVEYLGYYFDNVFEASDGLEGFEVYKQVKPDIIITDITMPKMNGLEMVEKIRQSDSETKVIVATAYLENEFLLKAVELGLVKYLIKPITEDKLLPILKKCADTFSKQDAIFCIDQYHSFDTINKTLFKGDEIVSLTKKEMDFLELLIQNSHRALKYEELNSVVWDGEMSEDAMRTVVKALRQKISKQSIKNISKIGYQIIKCHK